MSNETLKTLSEQTPFLTKTVQAAPLVFLILLWIYVYNPKSRHNKSFVDAIYGLAWVTLVIALYNIVLMREKFMELKTLFSSSGGYGGKIGTVTFLLWIVYSLIFLIIVLVAFSKNAKHFHKYYKFLEIGSWFYFLSFCAPSLAPPYSTNYSEMLKSGFMDATGAGFLKASADQVYKGSKVGFNSAKEGFSSAYSKVMPGKK
jgi:hypothetical protein